MAYSITINNESSANVTISNNNPNSGETVYIYSDSNDINAFDNEIDVSDQFIEISSLSTGFVANSCTANNTISGGGISVFSGAVGYSAENPNTTSINNGYAPSGETRTITYTFDFSLIPENATITSVNVNIYGNAESTTYDNTHKCEVTLFSNNIQKSTTQHFTSTSYDIMTIDNPGTWTRAELQDATLKVIIAYYGGRVRGITWTVNYLWHGFQYTISNVSSNHTIMFTNRTPMYLYYKSNGTWIIASKVYQKINNQWIRRFNLNELFEHSINYRQGGE